MYALFACVLRNAESFLLTKFPKSQWMKREKKRFLSIITCVDTNIFPSYSTGSKGLPLANIARPFYLKKIRKLNFHLRGRHIRTMVRCGETYLTPSIGFFSSTFWLCCRVRESHYQRSLQEKFVGISSCLNQNLSCYDHLIENNIYLINRRHGFNHFFCKRPSNASRSNQNSRFYRLMKYITLEERKQIEI